MMVGLRQPTREELLYDNEAIFKTRINRSGTIPWPCSVPALGGTSFPRDKAWYAVIPRGTKSFQVVKIIDRSVALDSPEFVEDPKKVAEVLKRFNCSDRKHYMKKFFDKYVARN